MIDAWKHWRRPAGYMVVELSQGLHEILLEPHLSPLRSALLTVDLGLFCLAAVVLVRHRRRR